MKQAVKEYEVIRKCDLPSGGYIEMRQYGEGDDGAYIIVNEQEEILRVESYYDYFDAVKGFRYEVKKNEGGF